MSTRREPGPEDTKAKLRFVDNVDESCRLCVHGHSGTAGDYCDKHYATDLVGVIRRATCDDFEFNQARADMRASYAAWRAKGKNTACLPLDTVITAGRTMKELTLTPKRKIGMAVVEKKQMEQGEYYEGASGERFLCVLGGPWPEGRTGNVGCAVMEGRSGERLLCLGVHSPYRHLPGCTGFDWVEPQTVPEPPAGYRTAKAGDWKRKDVLVYDRKAPRDGGRVEWGLRRGVCVGDEFQYADLRLYAVPVHPEIPEGYRLARPDEHTRKDVLTTRGDEWVTREFGGRVCQPFDPTCHYIVPITPKPTVYDYLEGHKASGLKVGDRVRIVRMPMSGENGWENGAVEDMEEHVGEVGLITRDNSKLGFVTDLSIYCWPHFCLEKIDEPAVDPGEGWRLLEPGEKVQRGDECRLAHQSSPWIPSINWEMADGSQSPNSVYRRRIAPQFRSFTAAEFAPHRDRWLRNLGTGTVRRVDHYSDKGVNGVPWDMAVRKWVFDDDSTPVGVKVEA